MEWYLVVEFIRTGQAGVHSSGVEVKDYRVLITGGLGFMGSNLARELMSRNKVAILDNASKGSNLKWIKSRNQSSFERNVTIFNVDIRDYVAVRRLVRKFEPDYVFHLAAVAGIETVIKDPFGTIEVNVLGSHSLARAIIDRPIKKLVYTSTSEVYGPDAFRMREDSDTSQGSPFEPRWSYATSKLLAEHLLVALQRQYRVPVAIGRLFNVYGPGQIGDGGIHNFIGKALRGDTLTIYGDGSQIRAWCYVDDIMNGLLIIAETGEGIFNIGNPREAMSIYALALLVKELAGSSSPIVFEDNPVAFADVRIRVPQIDKIKALGYEPRVNLREGVRKTIQYHRENLRKGIRV